MRHTPNRMIVRKLASLIDELQGSDDPVFTVGQINFLEKRFFEIQQDIEDSHEPEPNVPASELMETLCECVRILADFDEHDGEEGQVYRRCLATVTRLAGKPTRATHQLNTQP